MFYPEYSHQLIVAIADRIDDVLGKAKKGQELSEREQLYFQKKTDDDQKWDYEEEMRMQMIEGKTHKAMK